MASVTETQPPKDPAGETPSKGELLVDEQIRRTRRALKIVDLAAGMISLVIGVLVFLLTAAALDHWVIPGGWGTGGRTVLFLMLLAGVGWHGWHVFWPMLHQSINPAYAAQAIEQSSPALKNSLLNFLLLRKRKRRISRQVFQAIEQQAARGLSQVAMDSVVDRSSVLRLGYLLLAVVAICSLYRVLSPKDLFTSAGRVLLPWTNVIAPSRVQLSAISPGDTQTAKGERVDVSAEVLGLEEGEPVRLLYSTADQQIVEQEIVMLAAAGGVHFEAKLPQRMSEGGVQQDLTYWIEAGDARSPAFQVSVFARPTLIVQSVRYNYPDYTGYPSREETNTGDLRAVEGTVVTITAMSNQPIETGHVDFEADGRQDLLMKVDAQQATVSFPLELRDDRRTPLHQSYVLRYSTTKGRKNRLPPTYQIEVTPDYSPEIRLLSPEEEIVEVGVDDQVTIEVEARDPDFALRNVAILGEVAGQQVIKETLLSKKNHTGRFVGQIQLVPSQQGLKVGDVLEYWGAAADNRQPKANLAFTSRHKIRVVGPGEEGKQGSDPSDEGKSGEGEPQPGEGESDSSDEGGDESGGESGGESGESGGEQGQQGQGQSGAGEAGEGMSDEQNQQQGGKAGESESSEGNEDSQSESEGQAGGESEGEQQDGESPESEGGENSSGSKPSDEQASGNQEKVSPDGDDDAAAFDRMAEHFDEQHSDEQEENDANSEGDPSENDDPSGASKGEQQEGSGDSSDGTADPDQSDRGEGTEDAKTSEAGEEGNSNSAEGMPQESDSESGGAEGDPSEQQGEGSDQEGEQSQDDTGTEGQMSKEQGEAGAGENPGDNEGTTASEDGQAPEEKQGDPSTAGNENDEEAPSEGQGQTESDSEGSQGGDRSGGGQEGSGQQADAEGKGGAGEHQAADEGGSKSEQPGEGETSEQAGGEKQSDGPTGESSEDQAGNGSKAGDKAGDQAGGKNQGESGESQQGAADENMPSEGEPSEQPSGNHQDAPGGSSQPTAGGGQGGEGSPPPSSGEIEAGDEANLDYARQQTDLILNKLDDQLDQKEVDEKLLEKLGWSKDELRRFVDRWKNLKKQAAGEDESSAAKQQLDDALQSLGLGRNRQSGFHSQTAKDKLRELQDSYRGKIPLKYQQRVRAYVKGTATASEEE